VRFEKQKISLVCDNGALAADDGRTGSTGLLDLTTAAAAAELIIPVT